MLVDEVCHHRREGQDVEADPDVAEHFLMGQVAEPGWLVNNLLRELRFYILADSGIIHSCFD